MWETDGTIGLPDRAPYPRIIVTAGSPDLPDALFQQLSDGGRMVVPVADGEGERIVVVERVRGQRRTTRSEPCAFVPLIGEQGYSEPVDPWSP